MRQLCFITKPLLSRLLSLILIAVFLAACDGNSVDRSYIPVADAGDDQNTRIGEMITFDASDSSDVDGEVLSYRWEFVEKPANSNAIIVGKDTISPTLSPDVDGTYIIQLIVNDGKTDSRPDQIVLIVSDGLNFPIASAGDDQTGIVGELIKLAGVGSSSNGGDLSFNWVIKLRPEGSQSLLNNPESANPFFTPDKTGKYILELRVKNGDLESVPDEIIIRVTGNGTEGNNKPVAVAGQDQTVTIGSKVVLSGSASTDADHDELAYRWTLIRKPQNSIASTNGTSNMDVIFTPDVVGEYLFQLTVNDGVINSIPDSLKIMAIAVSAPPNRICTPNASGSKSCSIDNGSGEQARVCASDGSVWGSYEECTVTSCNSGYHKDGNVCVIDSSTQVCAPDSTESKECAINNGIGTQTRACATDGSLWSDYEGCKVTSCSTGYHKVENTCIADVQNNTPPLVNAGDDKVLNEGAVVSFLAKASDDGEIVKTEWFDKDSNLLGSELGLVLTRLGLGDHIFTVKVTDNGGLIATDEIKITIQKDAALLGSLSGVIIDSKKIPIPNVKVSLSTGEVTNTNTSGKYIFSDLKSTIRATVTASRYGFLQNSDIIKIQPSKETIQNIVLSRPEKISKINPSKKETIISEKMTIVLPKEGFVDKNGKTVDGELTLSSSYFPITTEEGVNEFPGDLQAERTDGETGELTSFGFIKIDLKDKDGNDVQIAPGKEIELSIPADDALDKPATIPFWFFDEEKGKWVEDGVATYDPDTNTYKTAVDTVNRAFNLDAFTSVQEALGTQNICVEDKNGDKVLASIIVEPENKTWRNISRTSVDGMLRLEGLIANNRYNYYAATDKGFLGVYADNPVYLQSLQAGVNTLNKCIVIDENNSTQDIVITGSVVDSSGNYLSNTDITIFGNAEGLTFGKPGLISIVKTKTDSNGKFRVDIEKTSVTALEVALLGKDIIIKASNESETYKKYLLNKGETIFNVGDINLSSNKPPVANAGLDEVIFLGSTVSLSAHLSYDLDIGDNIAQYEWRMGDKIVGTSDSYSSSSLSIGDHYFILTVTDKFGLKATDEVKVSIVDIQKHRLFVDAGIDKDVFKGGVSLGVKDTGTISVGSSITQVQWKEGNNLISNSSGFISPDLSIGEHTLTLLIKNEHGLEGSDDVTIRVHEKPYKLLVDAGIDKNYSVGEEFSIRPDIVTRHSAIKSIKWVDNDITVGTDYALTNPDLSIGTHNIQLVVTNDLDIEVTDEVTITIVENTNHSLYVDLGVDKFYYTTEIGHFNISTEILQSIGSKPVTYIWTLDNNIIYEDTSIYSSNEAQLPYWEIKELGLQAGSHTLKLTVKNKKGLEKSDDIVITIIESADHFLFSDAGLDKSFYVGDNIVAGDRASTLSVGSLFTSTTWKENDEVLFASSDVSSYSNILYGNINLAVGKHTLTRRVTNEHGLEASDDTVITIINKPVVSGDIFADAGLDKATYQGESVSIGVQNKSFSVNGGLSYKWTADDTVLGYDNWTYSPDLGIGIHPIKLTITDSQGFTATDTMNLKIIAAPDKWVYANAGKDMAVTQGESTYIKASGSASRYANLRYKWSENGNTLGTNYSILNYDATELGKHIIKLTVMDDTGTVTDTDEMTLTVVEAKDPPPLYIEIGQNKSIYTNERTLLQLDSPTGYTHLPNARREWTDNGRVLSTSDYFYFESTELGDHTIKVTLSDKDTNRVIGTDEIVITVVEDRPREVNANAGLDKTVYLGDYALLDSVFSYAFGGTIKETQWTENGVSLNYGSRSRVGYVAEEVGKYTVTLTVTDSNGLKDTDEVEITVLPKIQEIYSDAGKDKYIYQGETTTLGLNESYSLNNTITSAKWTENNKVISNSYYFDYKSDILGDHYITLEITDSAGLTASDDVVITVVSDAKVDKTPPNIKLIGASEITITQGDIYIDQGATATDDRDGVITENITLRNSLFTTYVLGKYSITYAVYDKAGNYSSISRIITIVEATGADVIPPTITLIGENPVNFIQGAEYNDAGITVLDNRDGDLGYSFNSNVNYNIPGRYEVVYTAKDTAGNTSTATRIVNVKRDPNIVIDTTKPVITLKGESTVSLVEGSVYNDAGATAVDDVDGDLTSSIVVSNFVDTRIVKDYLVTYKVKDKAGNEAIKTRVVNITKKPDEPDTLPPLLVKSLEWLETQAQSNGAYSNNSKIAMEWQSTAEVLRAYHKVGEETATGIAPAQTFMNAEDSKKVEALARKIILGIEAGEDVSAIVSELIQLQNIDSGFGDQAHYHSRVIDTAFALKALTLAQVTDTTITGSAVSYLKSQQSNEGGFSHSSKNKDSIYETALALLALQDYQGIYNLSNELTKGSQFLLDNQIASGGWATNWESAYALLAIELTAENKAAYQEATDNLKAAQLSNGSWDNEVYTTALVIRALYKAENALRKF